MSWEVDVKKVNDCWFLEKGWPNFVQENSLQDGDFLTFCYVAKSIFHVHIFSPNGCPKRGQTTFSIYLKLICQFNLSENK